MGWVQSSPTLNLVGDFSCFLSTFFDLINTSAPHIYHSALPLSPRTSIICALYKQYTRPLARVVLGLSDSWGPVVATTERKDFLGVATWSPCNWFIAVAKSEGVEICDTTTSNPLYTLKSHLDSKIQALSFFPTSHFLAQFNDEVVLTWNLQTGGLAGEFFSEGLQVDHSSFSSACSMDGKILAAIYSDQDFNCAFIVTHHLSNAHAHCHRISEGCVVPSIWTHGEFL